VAENDNLPDEAPKEDAPPAPEPVQEEVEVSKKKQETPDCPKCEECAPCKVGAPAWMATFADMATLLMAFFVLILSFAEMNVPKFKQISGSLKNSFGVQRLIPVVESPKAQSLIARSFSPSVAEPTVLDTIRQQTTEDRLENVELKTDVAPAAQQALETMRQALAQEISRGEAQVKFEGGKVVVEMTATPTGSVGPSGQQRGGNASGQQQGGASANGAKAAGSAASGSQQAGAGASGAQQAGTAAKGDKQAGSAANGAQQSGVVKQGEIEFYAKVAEAQAQVATAVEVRDVRGSSSSRGGSSGQGTGGAQDANSTYQRVRADMAKEIAAGKVEVERDGARIIIRLTEQGSFQSGRADLQAGFMQTLGQVASTVSKTQGRVYIEGHTDNVPVMFNERFRSNWDLSGARAGAVADYMSANGLTASRISVAGYADTRPIDSNDSAGGRSRNRRIEVIVDGADRATN